MTNTLTGEHLTVENFGILDTNTMVKKYTLDNGHGQRISVINLGGIITSLEIRDKAGNPIDVVLGYDTLQEYVDDSFFIGCLVGRYANRIKDGTFELEGVKHQLEKNDGENHLHGGVQGFHKAFWDIKPITHEKDMGLLLTYTSADGEQAYPGALDVSVMYLLKQDALEIRYTANTTKTTIVNLTQHTYFNLNQDHEQSVLDHRLQLGAEHMLELDESSCPTGEILNVSDTLFDFRIPKQIGSFQDGNGHATLAGYDHCYVLENQGALAKVAEFERADSLVKLEVWTTEPAIQLYTGNYLASTGKGGTTYDKHCGLCLETQHHPDSPNHAHFPSTLLRPGEVFESTTQYRWG